MKNGEISQITPRKEENEMTEKEFIKSAENMKKWCEGHFKENRCDCPFANRQYCKLHRTIPRFWDMPKPRPRISKFEYEFLKRLDSKIEYLARDRSGELCAFSELPVRKDNFWGGDSGGLIMGLWNIHDFLTFIKWEDLEPTSVQELMNEYEEYQNA